ncbi:MAG: hypothetical protein KF819_21750 [Labilithrix sp.]|nr:hypothetical protein [Labilithrix sp.]
MKRTHVCPKCQSRKFLVQGEFQVPDQDSSNGVDPFPAFTFSVSTFDRSMIGAFETWTCAGCGFTEFYARDFQALDISQSHGKVRYFDAAAPPGPVYR